MSEPNTGQSSEHSPKAWDKIACLSLEDSKSNLMPLKSTTEKQAFVWDELFERTLKPEATLLTHEIMFILFVGF